MIFMKVSKFIIIFFILVFHVVAAPLTLQSSWKIQGSTLTRAVE